MGDLQNRRRKERRLWLMGTVLMAVPPLRFATAMLMAPPPAMPIHAALLTPPIWLAQLLTPIDQSLQGSGLYLLPALVVLVLLLRRWVTHGRTLFKPLPVSATAGD